MNFDQMRSDGPHERLTKLVGELADRDVWYLVSFNACGPEVPR